MKCEADLNDCLFVNTGSRKSKVGRKATRKEEEETGQGSCRRKACEEESRIRVVILY